MLHARRLHNTQPGGGWRCADGTAISPRGLVLPPCKHPELGSASAIAFGKGGRRDSSPGELVNLELDGGAGFISGPCFVALFCFVLFFIVHL